MNVAELQLHQAIDSITDGANLEAIYTLLQKSEGPHKKMSMDEYVEAIDESRKQIEKGDFLSIEDLEKESKNW